MHNANKFLQNLSKVMHENRGEKKSEQLEKLYKIINDELYPILQTSHFPRTPAVMKLLSNELADLELLLTASMIIGKDVFSLSLRSVEKGFDLLKKFFKASVPSELKKTPSQIPILVYPNESFSIHAVNYANIGCELTLNEYVDIIRGCNECNIGAEKIIKYFCVGIPMNTDKVCCIFDNRTGIISDIFNRFIFKKIYVFDSKDWNDSIRFKEDTILFSNMDKILSSGYIKKFKGTIFPEENIISSISIESTCSGKDCIYGFVESIRVHVADIDAFYNSEFIKCERIKHAITEDIVRLGNKNTEILKDCRNAENDRYDILKNERNEIFIVIQKLIDLLSDIDSTLFSRKASQLNAPDYVTEKVLNQFIIYMDAGIYDMAQKLIPKIQYFGFTDWEMIGQYYVCSKNGFTQADCAHFCNRYPDLQPDNYIKAKMYINVIDPFKSSIKNLRTCAELLGNPKTGREYYIHYFLNGDEQMLYESLAHGYLPAGEVLYEKYKDGDAINLIKVADALVLKACVDFGDRVMLNKVPTNVLHDSGQKENSNKKLSITSSRMMYYKLAAAHGNVDAIERIVDSIYKERFASPATIRSDNAEGEKCAEILVVLCRYLMEHSEHPRRYNEYLGVVLFCMKNYSESFRTLSGCTSKAARYCRGRMYEAGNGTVKDYAKAEEEYRKAGNICDAEKRYNSVVEKQRQEEEKDDDDYSSETSYSASSYSSSSSSSGCFITTAACEALHKGDSCDELNLLRKFRDEHISDSTDGEKLIIEYYRIGPDIVDKINSSPNPKKVYSEMWKKYIKPSYDEINNQNWEKAKVIYINMVKELCQCYGVAVKNDIAEKYDIKYSDEQITY